MSRRGPLFGKRTQQSALQALALLCYCCLRLDWQRPPCESVQCRQTCVRAGAEGQRLRLRNSGSTRLLAETLLLAYGGNLAAPRATDPSSMMQTPTGWGGALSLCLCAPAVLRDSLSIHAVAGRRASLDPCPSAVRGAIPLSPTRGCLPGPPLQPR